MKADEEIKYRIFISSTFEDLRDYRKIVIRAVSQAEHMPIAIDNFSPREENDREVIKKAVAGCDFCILMIGYKYGELVKGIDGFDTISYTEYEYELALKYNKPILAFILRRDEIEKYRKKEYKSDSLEMKNTHAFYGFIDKVKKHSVPSHYSLTDPVDFAIKVTDVIKSKSNELEDRNDVGWIRATNYKNRELIGAALNNEFYFRTIKSLNNFIKLDVRCLEYSEEKKIAGQYFNHLFTKKIINGIDIFIESGSSTAYAAKAISKKLRESISLDTEGKPSHRIITNNILAYLELWLNNRIPCTFFPWGCPEEPYGASYGSISGFGIKEDNDNDEPKPNYKMAKIDTEAENNINQLSGLPYGINYDNNKPVLMLGAISGMQISGNFNISAAEGHTLDKKTEDDIRKCFGFHVGSYKNKIFKRFMYETHKPVLIFLNYEKIDCKIIAGKCHFIFDEAYTWENFLAIYPLAFIIGCKKSEISKIEEIFTNLKFQVQVYSATKDVTAVYAKNDNFPF